MSDPYRHRLMLFEPNSGGHHAGYIAHVLQAWRNLTLPGRIAAVVSPRLFDEHPTLRDLAFDDGHGAAEFVEMPEAPALKGRSLLAKGIGERRLLKEYTERLRPEHVVHMFMDHGQFALATGLRFSYPVEISGLFLRISHQRALPDETMHERVVRLRKRWLLWAALRNPHMGVVFSADPTVAPAVRALDPSARTATLPDPVPLPSGNAEPVETRMAYGVEPDRQLVLLFGVLAERKGVFKMLEALRRLPDAVCARLCVLFAGPVETGLEGRLHSAMDAVRREHPVQLLLHEAYLHEPEINALLGAADLALLPYQGHSGTSSVLIRASGTQRPVLSQSYGLMGEQVREHALGQAVDASDPQAIADGLIRFLENPTVGFDPARARAFAEMHTPHAYAEAMLAHLDLLTSRSGVPSP
ncbi:MAG: glycosyltransferase [Rhodothermales bacterium]